MVDEARRDAGWRSDWSHCHSASLVPSERALLAYYAVQLVDKHRIPGAIVEAGVWKGGMSCLMARAHRRMTTRLNRSAHRESYLFDTFDGMPAPNATRDGRKAVSQYTAALSGDTSVRTGCRVEGGKWCIGRLDEVQAVMEKRSTSTRVRYVQGKVEETLSIEANLPEQIAILRLDTDWFESTAKELDVLWPRLSPGGWLYVDDYYDFAGCARAVHEWAQRMNISRAQLQIGRDGRWGARIFQVFKSRPFDGSRPFVERNPLYFNDTTMRALLGT